MTLALWTPDPQVIANSNMMGFIAYCNKQYLIHIKNYQSLYTWSVTHPEQFWSSLWNFFSIKASKLWDQALVDGEKMPGAKWFLGSQLNMAENLLSRRDNKLALIFRNERDQRRTFTYAELYAAVAKVASALKASGVGVNDRVAGFLPNMPETVIAMLATLSIGAIWSSCSPDFGLRGVLDRFGQIEPKVLFTTDGYSYNGKLFSNLEKIQSLQMQLPGLEKTILIPYLSDNPQTNTLKSTILYNDFIAKNNPALTFAPLPFSHPAYIMFSSGTTGVPKCIVHSAGGTLIQHLKELGLHTNLTARDTIFYYTTCGWMMWNWFISSLALGATLILYDGAPLYPHASALFDLIDAEKITIFGTSAKYISAIEKAALEPIKTHNLGSLRTILSTGSPLLPENFDYVYKKIKSNVCLSSISGGTDILSCFALGNPMLPVYRGELQCIGLGMKVEIFDETGNSVREKKGELVCTTPFPSMPIYFWNDPDGKKYHQAYFEKYPNIWAHGDYAEITAHNGVIIYGRSDAVLNPGGIRIGTAEIYREVEKFPEILESIAVDQAWENDTRIILFVTLRRGLTLTDALKSQIKTAIKTHVSPHHVPAKIIQVPDIPRTISGKIVELAVRETIHNRPVKNLDALANPEVLEFFKNLEDLKQP